MVACAVATVGQIAAASAVTARRVALYLLETREFQRIDQQFRVVLFVEGCRFAVVELVESQRTFVALGNHLSYDRCLRSARRQRSFPEATTVP